jgi:hypothetical protein
MNEHYDQICQLTQKLVALNREINRQRREEIQKAESMQNAQFDKLKHKYEKDMTILRERTPLIPIIPNTTNNSGNLIKVKRE